MINNFKKGVREAGIVWLLGTIAILLFVLSISVSGFVVYHTMAWAGEAMGFSSDGVVMASGVVTFFALVSLGVGLGAYVFDKHG